MDLELTGSCPLTYLPETILECYFIRRSFYFIDVIVYLYLYKIIIYSTFSIRVFLIYLKFSRILKFFILYVH